MVGLIWPYLSLPNQYNYLTIARDGKYGKSTYQSNSGKPHELAAFNLEDKIIWAFDLSYLTVLSCAATSWSWSFQFFGKKMIFSKICFLFSSLYLQSTVLPDKLIITSAFTSNHNGLTPLTSLPLVLTMEMK
mgnify:CR=1 FL=1